MKNESLLIAYVASEHASPHPALQKKTALNGRSIKGCASTSERRSVEDCGWILLGCDVISFAGVSAHRGSTRLQF